MPPDPKPPARIVDREAGKAKAEFEGRCRVCGRRCRPLWLGGSSLTGLTRMHLISRKQGGDDVDANLMPGCWPCHELAEAHDPEVRARIREVMTEEEMYYIVDRRGWGWLDRFYPDIRPMV